MARNVKRFAAAALATAALSVAIPAGTAFAINPVDCGIRDYLHITVHATDGGSYDECFANAGVYNIRDYNGSAEWITYIWTGNNRVQWHGDGRWQPDSGPIDKWTSFNWPNNPGGVRIDQIQIL